LYIVKKDYKAEDMQIDSLLAKHENNQRNEDQE